MENQGNYTENTTKDIGIRGENLATQYLKSRGYRIVDKNYKKTLGEIDIIASKDGIVSFCEVKANSREYKGVFDPELRVDARKVSHISKVALIYLQQKGWEDKEWQIDIISVVIGTEKARIKHFKNIASAIY